MPGLLHLLDWHALGLGQADGRKQRVQHHTAGEEEEHSKLQHSTQFSSSVLSGQHAHSDFPQSCNRQAIPSSIWALCAGLQWHGVWYGKHTCILQSMVLKNCPMMKLAKKLKNTLMPCTERSVMLSTAKQIRTSSAKHNRAHDGLQKSEKGCNALPVQLYGFGAGASHWAPAKAVQGVSHCLNALTLSMQGYVCIPKGLPRRPCSRV